MKKVTRFQCSICGKLTAGRIPNEKGWQGDRTWRYPRRHKHNGKPCPGNILEAEWVDIEVKANGKQII